MLMQSNKKDIDVIMKIWKDNNIRFQSFIESQYWMDNYVKTKDEFLKSKIFIYTENNEILAFIVIDYSGDILDIQVKPEIQREGIGEILIQKAKQDYDSLKAKIFTRNNNVVLFYKAMGFRKNKEEIDDKTLEKVYTMEWNQSMISNSTFIYFDNSISSELINKYDQKSNVQFYNIHTYTHDNNNIFNINISNSLEKKNENIYISDYIDVRNKLNSIMKNHETIIFFDCNNDYSFLNNVIKDVVMVKNTTLKIIMHKPFSIEGGKKTKIYEAVKENFSEFELLDIDYQAIGENKHITLKEAFDMRDEELLKTVCKI